MLLQSDEVKARTHVPRLHNGGTLRMTRARGQVVSHILHLRPLPHLHPLVWQGLQLSYVGSQNMGAVTSQCVCLM